MLRKIWTIGSVSFRSFLPSKFKFDKRKERNGITFYPTITTPICLNKKQKNVEPTERPPVALCNIYPQTLQIYTDTIRCIDWNCVATIRMIWGYTNRSNQLLNLKLNDQRDESVFWKGFMGNLDSSQHQKLYVLVSSSLRVRRKLIASLMMEALSRWALTLWGKGSWWARS